MAEPIKVIGESLQKELTDLIREKRGRRPKANPQPHQGDELWTPEVYIARTPSGGIPALSQGADTGTDEVGLSDDAPGSAECDIWRIDSDDQLLKVEFQKTVYNLSDTAIDGDSWVLVIRDKFGSWMVSVSGSGSDNDAVVRVSSTTPNGDGYYPGFVQSYDVDTNTWADGEEIWILNLNP